mmetsp:Transcript_38448/g.89387  ORF Transcript_38448/g.89387 Transcript_38448/m.89387 type:complete len:261 (-) Transcript_38448:159-941(-)
MADRPRLRRRGGRGGDGFRSPWPREGGRGLRGHPLRRVLHPCPRARGAAAPERILLGRGAVRRPPSGVPHGPLRPSHGGSVAEGRTEGAQRLHPDPQRRGRRGLDARADVSPAGAESRRGRGGAPGEGRGGAGDGVRRGHRQVEHDVGGAMGRGAGGRPGGRVRAGHGRQRRGHPKTVVRRARSHRTAGGVRLSHKSAAGGGDAVSPRVVTDGQEDGENARVRSYGPDRVQQKRHGVQSELHVRGDGGCLRAFRLRGEMG